MRIITIINLSSLLFVSFLSSCTKNDNPTPISGKVKTVKTSWTNSSGFNSFIYNYNYNNNGTINYISIMPGHIKLAYAYTSNKVTSTIYDSLNIPGNYDEYFLGSNGLVDSISYHHLPQDSLSAQKFVYNSNNEPIQITTYNGLRPPLFTFNTYNNGNLIKHAVSSSQYFYSYEYYPTVSNLTPEAYGIPYSLHQSTNLQKTVRLVNSTNPSDTQITSSFTYTFDSNNRVITSTYHFYDNGLDNGEPWLYEYTYY